MKVLIDSNNLQAIASGQLIAELKKPGKCIVDIARSEFTVSIEKADLIASLSKAPKNSVLFKAIRGSDGTLFLSAADND